MKDRRDKPNGALFEDKFARVYAEVVRLDQLRAADTGALARLHEEQIRRLDQRMQDADKAVSAALIAAKEAVAAALVAAEKAVDKAETAQQKVNDAQVENRGTLKDQARELMPRIETENLFRELRSVSKSQDIAISDLRSRLDIGPPSLSTLQSRSDEGIGRKGGALEARAFAFAAIAAIVGVGGLIFGIIALITK